MWICLFTCCATRAVHLDLVVDMTATSFILCFRRFRSVPQKLISENSKTFKSANKIIVAMLSHPDVEKFFRGKDWEYFRAIDWFYQEMSKKSYLKCKAFL